MIPHKLIDHSLDIVKNSGSKFRRSTLHYFKKYYEGSGGVFRTHLNIYDGTFFAKIVSG